MAGSLPTPGLFVDDTLRTEFNTSVRQLIADMGVEIKLIFEPTASGCPNCFAGPDGTSNGKYDATNPFLLNGPLHKVFPNGMKCPVCQGSHEIKTENSTTIKMLREWAPEDVDVTPYGTVPQNVVRTKSEGCHKDDIRRARKASVDGDVVVRIGDPIPAGLAPPQFVDALWKKED